MFAELFATLIKLRCSNEPLTGRQLELAQIAVQIAVVATAPGLDDGTESGYHGRNLQRLLALLQTAAAPLLPAEAKK